MNFVDRQRIEWALVRYDFWMDGGTFPWVIPLLALTSFVLAAQPWRPLTHRRGRSRATTQQRA